MAWERKEKTWYRCGHFLCFVITSILFRPKIVGKKNLPKKGAYIISPNHRSMIDIPALGCATFRPLRFMAKKDLFKNKFVKWYFETNGSFSVDKDSSDPTSVKKSLKYLNSGDALVIFPEGKRSKLEHVAELAQGVGFIAVKTKVPIIPVGISGIDKALTRKQFFPVFSKAKIVIGEPITSHLTAEGKTSEVSKLLLEELSIKIQNLYEKSLYI